MPDEYHSLALVLALLFGSTGLAACGGAEFEAAPSGGGGTNQDGSAKFDTRPPQDDARMSQDASDTSDGTGDDRRADGTADARGNEPATDGPADEADGPGTDGPGDTKSSDAATDNSDSNRIFDAKDADAKGAADSDSSATDATCEAPVLFYRDRDGDGFGVTGESISACTPPSSDAGAWVTRPGDCRDDLPEVKPYLAGWPNPPVYSGTGYSDPTQPGGISFDFDCNGIEQADPANAFGTEPVCPALLTNCNGTGYVPTTPSRTGVGVNTFCGSSNLKSCVVSGLSCREQFIATTAPFRCR